MIRVIVTEKKGRNQGLKSATGRVQVVGPYKSLPITVDEKGYEVLVAMKRLGSIGILIADQPDIDEKKDLLQVPSAKEIMNTQDPNNEEDETLGNLPDNQETGEIKDNLLDSQEANETLGNLPDNQETGEIKNNLLDSQETNETISNLPNNQETSEDTETQESQEDPNTADVEASQKSKRIRTKKTKEQ